jgi:hypothetical protein
MADELAEILEALERRFEGCEQDGVSDLFIATTPEDGQLILGANRCGLIYLATVLVDLALHEPGQHFHLDKASVLEYGQEIVLSHVATPT